MQQLLKDIYLKHDIWIDIVKSFGCKHYYAEDIVQEMYIKIIRYHNKGLNIDYGDKDFNYYYIFLTLKTLYFNLQKKENFALINTKLKSYFKKKTTLSFHWINYS